MSGHTAVTGSIVVNPAGGGAAVNIAYELNVPPGNPDPPSTVLLLVAGGTYNRSYWDLPDPTGGSKRYSFVAAANQSGFATLAIDTVGRGSSTRPHSSECTVATDAQICDEFVQRLKAGTLVDDTEVGGFANVVGVGHSWGSVTMWLAATEYDDFDGVILTGAAHRTGTDFPTFIPANTDPAFSGLGLDDGYLTTPTGNRTEAFYDPGRYDPALVAWDDEHRDLMSMANVEEDAGMVAMQLDIRAHTLLVIGQEDVFCKSGTQLEDSEKLLASESPFLGPDIASLEAYLLPEAGHCINGALNAPDWYAVATTWLERRFGCAAP